MARFTSVDPDNAGVRLGNPQSWNGYGYSINNPLRYVDPDGKDFRDAAPDHSAERADPRACAAAGDLHFNTFQQGWPQLIES